MSDKLRVAVVGVGYLGRFHALIYSRMPDVELVGVVDADAERAQRSGRRGGLRRLRIRRGSARPGRCGQRRGAHHRPSGGRRALPGARHRSAAGKADRHDPGRGPDDRRLAPSIGAMLQIGHLERFNAGVMALAERITAPRYIEAQRMGGFVERATDVDVVSDLMIHDIDIILSLVDAEIAHISAVGTSVLTAHVDIANARLEFANGAVANVIASRVSRQEDPAHPRLPAGPLPVPGLHRPDHRHRRAA